MIDARMTDAVTLIDMAILAKVGVAILGMGLIEAVCCLRRTEIKGDANV